MTTKDEILSLRAQGKTYSEISTIVGCAKSLISYYCNPETKKKSIDRSLRARQKRLDLINGIKESKPCVDCGNFFEGFLMDFDHLPGYLKVKKVSSLIQSASWKAVLQELIKCELVCCMCHRIRTRQRWQNNPLLSE